MSNTSAKDKDTQMFFSLRPVFEPEKKGPSPASEVWKLEQSYVDSLIRDCPDLRQRYVNAINHKDDELYFCEILVIAEEFIKRISVDTKFFPTPKHLVAAFRRNENKILNAS